MVEIKDGSAPAIQINSDLGNVSFRPSEISFDQPRAYLDGLVRIEKVPPTVSVAETRADEDYPALAAAPEGGVWAAWVSFVGNGERLLLAKMDGAGRAEPVQVNEGLTEVFHPQIAVDGAGRVWVVWSELRDDNWDLYARAWQGDRFSDIYRLTTDPGPDIYPSITTDRAGTLWLAWQGHHGSKTSDILLTSCRGGNWSQSYQVIGSHPANDWEPSVAVSSAGRVIIAWDSYRDGTYDVYVAQVEGQTVSEPARITGGDRLHIRPSIAIDQQDRVWIAWEEGDDKWGQDMTQNLGGLHRRRQVKLACLQGTQLRSPAQVFDPHKLLGPAR